MMKSDNINHLFVSRIGRLSSWLKCLVALLAFNVCSSPASAQDLDPTVPPSENFDLSYWKITRPNQQERDEFALTSGWSLDGEFYTDPNTGAMVFWCPNDGQTGGSTYPRNELREMIRRGDTSIGTQGINKNNWVFSSSTMANQEASGGVDGIMTATVAVDHVSLTSDETRKIGRTIVGQIHASNDEPCRIYYRKLPENSKGSIYFAHEPIEGAEQWYDMIGSRNDGISDPEDGVALGEKFSYEIKAIGNTLTVTIMRDGKDDVVQEVDMTNSGFEDDWMYFKAGNYNQNNAGDAGEYAQVSFFALDVIHFSPTPPTSYEAPSDIPRFQPILRECKLQAPTSSTIASIDRLNGSYIHPEYFYVVDGDKMLFHQSGDSQRTELRHETNWDLNDENRSLHGRLDITEMTCDQVTVMQIHDDAGAGNGPNKPLLRIYKHNAKDPVNHIWAAIKTDIEGVATTHIDLGEDPGGYFNCDIRLVDGRMIIDFEGEEKVNMDVSFWTWPSYWKAGVYLQDSGDATVHFDELFEQDGSPQNYFPSVTISDPLNGANFTPGSDIPITVDAVDSDGVITKVEFFEGGTNKLAEVTTPPYTFTWPSVAEGNYILTAKATDNEGGSKTSLSTYITVQVNVPTTAVDLIDLSGPIAVGGSIQLEAALVPADATSNVGFVFESDDESIVSVTSDGFLSAISEGETTVTVTTDDGEFVDSQLIKVLTPSTEYNWAWRQSVTATGEPDGSNVPTNLVDNLTGTRWSVMEFPQSAVIDLGAATTITQTEVTCYQDRAYQFIIESALEEDGPFTTVIDRSSNRMIGTPETPILNDLDNIESRYLKVTVTGADIYTGTWVSLTELRVFGDSDREMYSSVDDIKIDESLVISPNPVSSTVKIVGDENYDQITLYNQSGLLITQEQMQGKSHTLDLSSIQSGIYIIELRNSDRLNYSKLLKL